MDGHAAAAKVLRLSGDSKVGGTIIDMNPAYVSHVMGNKLVTGERAPVQAQLFLSSAAEEICRQVRRRHTSGQPAKRKKRSLLMRSSGSRPVASPTGARSSTRPATPRSRRRPRPGRACKPSARERHGHEAMASGTG